MERRQNALRRFDSIIHRPVLRYSQMAACTVLLSLLPFPASLFSAASSSCNTRGNVGRVRDRLWDDGMPTGFHQRAARKRARLDCKNRRRVRKNTAHDGTCTSYQNWMAVGDLECRSPRIQPNDPSVQFPACTRIRYTAEHTVFHSSSKVQLLFEPRTRPIPNTRQHGVVRMSQQKTRENKIPVCG